MRGGPEYQRRRPALLSQLPTIVHFSAVLLMAGLLRVPWPTTEIAAAVVGGLGLGGVAYAAAVARRIRKQNAYRPEFEDWLCHFALPLAAYAGIGVSALAVASHTREALFGVANGALLLLFTGIHNAWDAVTWHVLVDRPDASAGGSNRQKQRKGRQ